MQKKTKHSMITSAFSLNFSLVILSS